MRHIVDYIMVREAYYELNNDRKENRGVVRINRTVMFSICLSFPS